GFHHREHPGEHPGEHPWERHWAHHGARHDPAAERRQEIVKFRVERDVFADAVAWTARSIPTRPGTLPQLSGILMTTGPTGLTLSGIEYDTSASVTLAHSVSD